MRALAAIVVSLAMTVAGCGLETEALDGEDDDLAEVEGDDPAATEDGKDDSATRLPLRFLPGELFLPTARIQDEVRRVFRTEAALEAALGIENPGIDFAREWAVFYTPGLARTDLLPGFMARIDTVRVSSTGLTIMVTTSLEQNGDCAPRRSRPFLLVAVPRPATPPPYTRFYRNDRTRSCPTDVTYLDGVAFTAAQLAASLRAANLATDAQLGAAGITGTQRSIITGGRTWPSLALVASTSGIGATTMTKLRTLGDSF
ncbi:MAG: hypothetical protein K8M05_18290 [Deltaproteobacteria bacterium]|nr:hypothetical protein [Kofleriaceae bacterium]